VVVEIEGKSSCEERLVAINQSTKISANFFFLRLQIRQSIDHVRYLSRCQLACERVNAGHNGWALYLNVACLLFIFSLAGRDYASALFASILA
jgi:hypothetical protein